MKIAIIGGGISGLLCAHLLHKEHELTLFESNDYLGGHVHTEHLELDGRSYAIDTGFNVFSMEGYPNFVRLLGQLGVHSIESPLSFSVSCERTGIEYNTRSANQLLAQRRNLLRPAFLRMVFDIARLGAEARAIAEHGDDTTTIVEYLRRKGYSQELLDLHLIPAGATLWSTQAARVRAIPARWFVKYFQRHGFLGLRRGLTWHNLPGGADCYVSALSRPFRDRVRLSTPVQSVRRSPEGVTLQTRQGESLGFDRVIFANHGDDALVLLADPSEREREILGAFAYDNTDSILHTDTSILPRRRRAWAAWNARLLGGREERIAITYNVNIVQALKSPHVFCVTLFGSDRVDPARVLRRYRYRHPVFTPQTCLAQARHDEVNGPNRTHFCDAYWGYGYHEDGVNSALSVCQHFGKKL